MSSQVTTLLVQWQGSHDVSWMSMTFSITKLGHFVWSVSVFKTYERVSSLELPRIYRFCYLLTKIVRSNYNADCHGSCHRIKRTEGMPSFAGKKSDCLVTSHSNNCSYFTKNSYQFHFLLFVSDGILSSYIIEFQFLWHSNQPDRDTMLPHVPESGLGNSQLYCLIQSLISFPLIAIYSNSMSAHDNLFSYICPFPD